MNGELRRYILIEAAIAFIANEVINGLIAWLLNLKNTDVPTDALTLLIDIGITAPLLSMFNAMSAAASLKKHGAAGVCRPRCGFCARAAKAMQKPAAYGLLLGLVGFAVLYPAALGFFALLGRQSLPLIGYILYKSAYTGLLAAAVISASLRSGLNACE